MKNFKKILTALITANITMVSTINVIACKGKNTQIDISDKIPTSIILTQVSSSNIKKSFLNALQEKLITIQDLNNITTADYDVYKIGTTDSIEDSDIISTNWLSIKIVAKGNNFTGTKDNIMTEYTRNITEQNTIYLDEDGIQQTTNQQNLSGITTKEIIQIGFYQNTKGEIQVVAMPRVIEKVPTQLPLKITSLQYMFNKTSAFNQDISQWNTSNVTSMFNMFTDAISFNQDISQWNTSNVINMSYMFYNASAFNQDISQWNTSNVTNMTYMFNSASAFNQDLSQWNVKNVIRHNDFALDSGFANDPTKWPPFIT